MDVRPCDAYSLPHPQAENSNDKSQNVASALKWQKWNINWVVMFSSNAHRSGPQHPC